MTQIQTPQPPSRHMNLVAVSCACSRIKVFNVISAGRLLRSTGKLNLHKKKIGYIYFCKSVQSVWLACIIHSIDFEACTHYLAMKNSIILQNYCYRLFAAACYLTCSCYVRTPNELNSISTFWKISHRSQIMSFIIKYAHYFAVMFVIIFDFYLYTIFFCI